MYGILKYKERFEAVRAFTLESGQQELERQRESQKSGSSAHDLAAGLRRPQSEDDLQTPSGARPSLSRIPEENNPFAIGGDDSDEEGDEQPTPSLSSPSLENSRRPSVSSSADESVPVQLRGMSEKARGKMPAGRPSFSRQNSVASQSSVSLFLSSSNNFIPTAAWVSADSFLVLFMPQLTNLCNSPSLNLGCQNSLCTLCLPLSLPFLHTYPMLLLNLVRIQKRVH